MKAHIYLGSCCLCFLLGKLLPQMLDGAGKHLVLILELWHAIIFNKLPLLHLALQLFFLKLPLCQCFLQLGLEGQVSGLQFNDMAFGATHAGACHDGETARQALEALIENTYCSI